MERRDARGFLEQVLSGVDNLDEATAQKLLAAVADKAGTKRAAKLAAILAAATKATDD